MALGTAASRLRAPLVAIVAVTASGAATATPDPVEAVVHERAPELGPRLDEGAGGPGAAWLPIADPGAGERSGSTPIPWGSLGPAALAASIVPRLSRLPRLRGFVHAWPAVRVSAPRAPPRSLG